MTDEITAAARPAPTPRAWLLPFALGWLSATLGAIAAFALVHFS